MRFWFVISIFVSQFVYSFVIAPITQEPDFFPFHRWALFQKAARGFTVPVLYIYDWNGTQHDPPISAHDFFKGNQKVDFLAGWDHVNYWTQIMDSDPERARKEKMTFEKHYFGEARVKYSIRLEKVDQVEYRKTREVIETVQEFGPFHYGEETKNDPE